MFSYGSSYVPECMHIIRAANEHIKVKRLFENDVFQPAILH